MIFGTTGEPALAAGWTTRAERLLDELGPDAAEAGYVSFLHMYRAPRRRRLGRPPPRRPTRRPRPAVGTATATWWRSASSPAGGSRSTPAARPRGWRRSTRRWPPSRPARSRPRCSATSTASRSRAARRSPRFDRVAEWTSALHRWCASQPGLVAFTGQCSVHRGQVMRQRGAWAEALEEFARAAERYRLANSLDAIGQAEGERGDVLRLQGEYAAAEAAYQRAGEHGFDPQPGLALLWLARGSRDAAAAAVRRLVAEAGDPVGKCRVLPAAVDVLLAVEAIDEARAVAAELDQVASAVGSAAMLAFSAYASGAVELAAGDAAGALPYLRKARQLWARVECPYEVARVRLLTGRALTALGDEELGAPGAGGALATPSSTSAPHRRPTRSPASLEPARLPGGLTAREVEVLRLVASGRSNPQIATDLALSEKTVARHLSNIFAKLDVGSRTAAAAYAYEHGLV